MADSVRTRTSAQNTRTQLPEANGGIPVRLVTLFHSDRGPQARVEYVGGWQAGIDLTDVAVVDSPLFAQLTEDERDQLRRHIQQPAPDAEDDQPLDLHQVYREEMQCGYDRDLLLHAHTVQSIQSRLRAINVVSAVLFAGDTLGTKMSDWMRSGLIEAVHALSADAAASIEEANTRAKRVAKGVAA